MRSASPLASAALASSRPRLASIALLAVTTGLPAASAACAEASAAPLCAADQLHEDVDVGAARERDGIVVPGEARQVDSAVAVSRSRAHARYDDRAAAAHLQAMLLALEQPDHGGADGAETGDTDAQGRQHERRSEFMEGRVATAGRR